MRRAVRRRPGASVERDGAHRLSISRSTAPATDSICSGEGAGGDHASSEASPPSPLPGPPSTRASRPSARRRSSGPRRCASRASRSARSSGERPASLLLEAPPSQARQLARGQEQGSEHQDGRHRVEHDLERSRRGAVGRRRQLRLEPEGQGRGRGLLGRDPPRDREHGPGDGGADAAAVSAGGGQSQRRKLDRAWGSRRDAVLAQARHLPAIAKDRHPAATLALDDRPGQRVERAEPGDGADAGGVDGGPRRRRRWRRRRSGRRRARGSAPAMSPARAGRRRRPAPARIAPSAMAAPAAASLLSAATASSPAARPSAGRSRRSRAGRRCRARAGRSRASRTRRAAGRSRSSFAARRERASRALSRTGRGRPPEGSTTRTTTEPTSGKLCSQTGSWITTGTTSQRWAPASSQAEAGGGARKSERMNTKLPGGIPERIRPRKAIARSRLSSGASNPVSGACRCSISHSSPRPPGGSQYGPPCRGSRPGVVERADVAARGDRAEHDQLRGGVERRRASRARETAQP